MKIQVRMQPKIYAFILVSFFIITTHAQSVNNGRVSGKILLEVNIPAKNATISLLRGKDSVAIKLAIPDDNGYFEFEHIKAGNYLISVSHTGYKKYISTAFSIDEKNAAVDLASITLLQNSNNLSGVTVQSTKPFIERKADRLIVNVENSITSTGSTALEVLEKSPGIFVNQESGINLKGKSGVSIMIDGKLTPLSGADLITYLKSVPASNIERIEIITNPSAKYDAAGNAGIIDIRFKKDKRQGYNGSVSLSSGQGVYNRTSPNGSINYRNKKWNLFSNAAYTTARGFTNFYINRKFFNPTTKAVETIFDQTTYTKQPQQSSNIKLGADFYSDKKNVFGLLFNGTFYQGKRDGLSNSVISNSAGALQYTNQTANLLNDKRYNVFGNFNYKHTFDSTGKELSADIDFGKINAKPLQDILSRSFDVNNVQTGSNTQKSDQRSTITVKSFKMDYLNPLKRNAKLEAGIKTSFVTTDNDVKFFDVVNGSNVLDVTRSNHFIYTENVNAAYVNYYKEFKDFSWQAGLRMEHTYTKARQITTSQDTTRNYVLLFPSFSITQKLSAKHEIALSYSRRIDRPTYRQLNPFKILVDSYTYVLGDPNLDPSLSNSYEFTYTYNGKYSATLSYVQSKDVITDIFIQDDATKISSQIPANIQTYRQYDLTVNIPVTIKKWMNANSNTSLTYNDYKSPLQGANLTNRAINWSTNLTSSFIMGKKGWSAELNGFYQSKVPWGLFIIKNLAQVSAGVQKISANKKSVYKLAIADAFYTNHIAVIVQYENQDWHTDRRWDSRFVTLSYTYRFGKNTVPRARQRTSGVEDEKRRAN
jgi:iron complex outermembrane recepter protein